MKSIFFALLIALSFSSKSFAGWHVEPYLGYMLLGDADDDSTSSGVEYDLDYHPFLLGGRFGYNLAGFIGGLDFSLSPNFTLKSSSKTSGTETSTKYDYSASYMGLFVGYNFPAMFRLWITYYLRAELEGEELPVRDDELKGNGFGLGFGYTGLPIPALSLNAELRKPTFDESFDKSSGTTRVVDYSALELFLSLSAAFDL